MSLTVKGIQKNFGKKIVLDGVDFELEEGRIYGLLGRNGAGKSTLLNIINNRLVADRGEVTLNGKAVYEQQEQLRKLFLTNDKNLFPSTMKVKGAFAFAKRLYPDFDESECQRLAERFELDVKMSISKLSTGYQSIFKLILGLCMPVKFLFLDEPVLGLDASYRDLFYEELMASYERNPRTIVISTHLIEEVSHLIEHVLILNRHRIEVDANVEELLSSAFMVTGSKENVQEAVSGMRVLATESLGNVDTAYVIGDKSEWERVTVQRLDLQRLFVLLMKGGEV